nr:hypothetical protein CFP56_66934 [Quercus suber]
MSSSTARVLVVGVVVGPRLRRLRIWGGSGRDSGSESMTSGPKSSSWGAGVWVWGSESRPSSSPRENEGAKIGIAKQETIAVWIDTEGFHSYVAMSIEARSGGGV